MDEAIGIFDSGVGGLTVVKEILEQLPGENIIYFGDTARVPYGTKSLKLVKKYALQDTRFLVSCGIKLLIVACNTVSAVGLENLAQELSIPVVGVVEAGCSACVKATKNKKVGVIGTAATISSGIYPRVINELDSTVKVICKSCPLFVPLVEEGWLDREITMLTVREYLSILKGLVDTLILGCTHYPLLRSAIEEEMGKETVLIDSAGAVAARVKKILEDGEIVGTAHSNSHRYFVSDDPDGFRKMAKLFIGKEILSIEEIDIEEY